MYYSLLNIFFVIDFFLYYVILHREQALKEAGATGLEGAILWYNFPFIILFSIIDNIILYIINTL